MCFITDTDHMVILLLYEHYIFPIVERYGTNV